MKYKCRTNTHTKPSDRTTRGMRSEIHPTSTTRLSNAWPNGICGHCGAIQQAAGIGLEATLAEHLDSLVSVFRELRRVLRDDGSVWLNYGDAYARTPVGNYKGLNGDGTRRW